MAYEKGLVRVGVETDCRSKDYDDVRCISLPHSCSRWVVGGPEEAMALVRDLLTAIKEWEAK